MRTLAGLCMIALALPAWIAAPAASVRAATITVTSTADAVATGDGCTLREAIQAANTDAAVNECAAGAGADTIDASGVSGTITLTGALPDISTDLTLRGSATAGGLTIYGNFPYTGDTAPPAPLTIRGGATATLSRVTITKFYGGVANAGTLTISDSSVSGNGIFGIAGSPGITNTGTLTLVNSAVRRNSAAFANAGGISNTGSLTISGSTISGNSASSTNASGIFNTGTLTLTDSTVSDNSGCASFGGSGRCGTYAAAIGNNGGTARITGNTVSGNASGIDNVGNGTLTVTNTSVSDNAQFGIANGRGGSYASRGTLSVTNSTISGNARSDSSTYGGGITNAPDSTMTVTNSTVAENAFSGGQNSGTLTVTSSTIARNLFYHSFCCGSAPPTTYGIENSGTLNVGYSIVADNVLAGNMGSDISGPFAAQGSNFIGGDPRLGPLQNNGGPTQTLLPLPGSPVIDAGGACPVATDQRGVPRPQGIACDLGAVEVGPLPAPRPRATAAPASMAPVPMPPTRAAQPPAAQPQPRIAPAPAATSPTSLLPIRAAEPPQRPSGEAPPTVAATPNALPARR